MLPMPELDYYLKEVVDRGGSDLHLAANSPPLLRLHGNLVRLSTRVLAAEDTERILLEILTDHMVSTLRERKNIDFAYQVSHAGMVQRFRANVFFQRFGLDGSFRIIPNNIPTLRDLGLPMELARLTRYHQGLVLVTGPAGSGKTSTLAAFTNIINEERSCHIITIEDPIEYVHQNRKSLINQRQVGLHTRSFRTALRSAVREDPDVILVGELRDLETIQMAITASETGHLVFTTLPTTSGAKTIDRLINAFSPAQQTQVRTMLSESLRGIVSQQLLPRTDGLGRVPAVEVIVGCLPVANLIREGKTYQIQSVMQTGKHLGMRLMDESLLELLNQRRITPHDAYEAATDKTIFEPLIRR